MKTLFKAKNSSPFRMQQVALLIGALLFAFVASASQEQALSVGRYISKQTAKYEAGLASFEKVAEIVFPKNTMTVGDAITLVMDDAGYGLLPAALTDKTVANVLRLHLPKDHRALGPMTKKDMLRTLVGPGFVLVVDPVSRKLTFKLRESYALL